MQEGNLLTHGVRTINEGRIHGFDVAANKILEKAAQCDKMISLSDWLERFTCGCGITV